MANFVTANIVAANEGLNSALDGLDALTSGIIGGILSIPAIPTALVTAQHAIMVAQIIKALPKLPSLLIQDVNLQAELITLATLKVGSVAYETAFNKLDDKFGSALKEKGYELASLATETSAAISATTDTVARGKRIANNVPNYVVSQFGQGKLGVPTEIAQNALLSSASPHIEKTVEFVTNPTTLELKENIKGINQFRQDVSDIYTSVV